MSRQGPVLFVDCDGGGLIRQMLSGLSQFPMIEVAQHDAAAALADVNPAAVLSNVGTDERWRDVAATIERTTPYLPLLALGDATDPPDVAIRFGMTGFSRGNWLPRLEARLNAALRVRSLHETVLRRTTTPIAKPSVPLDDASVLLIGRSRSYAELSVAAGKHMHVIGALSIEAAARHLNLRDLNGVIIGGGFSPRALDAFLTVLAEKPGLRDLPVAVHAGALPAGRTFRLPNLEYADTDEPAALVDAALPLIRQHALAARLQRQLQSLDAGGIIDVQTGLLTQAAFARDLSGAVGTSDQSGAALTAARFALDTRDLRLAHGAARTLARLMRQMDFATLDDDGAIVTVFSGVDMHSANVIARRFADALKPFTTTGQSRSTPRVTLATLQPGETADALLASLRAKRRAGS